MSIHAIWTLVQIHIYANKIRCINVCDVRQLSNPVIFKIYKDLDQMQQKAGKIKVQEDEGNGEKHLRHTQLLKKKKNCYNNSNNQEAPVSFLQQTNGKAVDDKGKETDFRKSKNDFDAECMEIKPGSSYSGNPGKQPIFTDPKQTDVKNVLKSRNDENKSATNSTVSADNAAKCSLPAT